MIQEMINGSIAVLTNPSAQTFEQHERDNLGWALIYASIAGVVNAVIAAIWWTLQGAFNTTGVIVGSILGGIIGTIIGTIIGSLIVWSFIYLLGRAFGGTGSFGELAWNISLFSSPLSIVQNIAVLIPFLGPVISILLILYGVYLTYLAIQSGMNLPAQKALYIAIILVTIAVLFICAFLGLAAIGIAVLSGGLSP